MDLNIFIDTFKYVRNQKILGEEWTKLDGIISAQMFIEGAKYIQKQFPPIVWKDARLVFPYMAPNNYILLSLILILIILMTHACVFSRRRKSVRSMSSSEEFRTNEEYAINALMVEYLLKTLVSDKPADIDFQLLKQYIIRAECT